MLTYPHVILFIGFIYVENIFFLKDRYGKAAYLFFGLGVGGVLGTSGSCSPAHFLPHPAWNWYSIGDWAGLPETCAPSDETDGFSLFHDGPGLECN